MLLDFKSVFDTVRYGQFLETLRDGFGVQGHAYEYMQCCFEGRRSRVDITGFKSDWRDEVLGLLQGWPPAAVAFVYFVSEFEFVDKKIDGVRLPCYADDTTLECYTDVFSMARSLTGLWS